MTLYDELIKEYPSIPSTVLKNLSVHLSDATVTSVAGLITGVYTVNDPIPNLENSRVEIISKDHVIVLNPALIQEG